MQTRATCICYESPRLLQRTSGGPSAINHRAAATSPECRCPLGERTSTSRARDFISTRSPLASNKVLDYLQAVPDDAQHPRRSQPTLHNRHSRADSKHAQPRATSFISEQQVLTASPTSQGRRASVFVLRTRFIVLLFLLLWWTTIFCTFLDAMKVFDRVNYAKLFKLLVHRMLLPVDVRLLLNMYNSHVSCISWN